MELVYEFTQADKARINYLQQQKFAIDKEIADIYMRTRCHYEFDRTDKMDCYIVDKLIKEGNITESNKQVLKTDFILPQGADK